jgi:hypothetical protein
MAVSRDDMHLIATRTTKNMYFLAEQSEQEVESGTSQGSVTGFGTGIGADFSRVRNVGMRL